MSVTLYWSKGNAIRIGTFQSENRNREICSMPELLPPCNSVRDASRQRSCSRVGDFPAEHFRARLVQGGGACKQRWGGILGESSCRGFSNAPWTQSCLLALAPSTISVVNIWSALGQFCCLRKGCPWCGTFAQTGKHFICSSLRCGLCHWSTFLLNCFGHC